jgi:hypothetical protein
MLGTEANVRLLRVLAAEVNGALGAPDLADRTGLSLPGARKALRALVTSGIVRPIGSGRAVQYALAESGDLAQSVAALFRAERERYDQLLHALRTALDALPHPPRSAWLLGTPRQPWDALVLGILHTSKQLESSVSNLRHTLEELEAAYDVSIEIEAYTRADLPDYDEEEIRLLTGLPIAETRQAHHAGLPSHEDVERRALRRAEAVSLLVAQDRSLLRRAKEHVERVLESPQGTAQHDLREWRGILQSYSVPRLQRFLTSASPRSVRLRSSCPFFAVLTNMQRRRLLELAGEKP